MKKNFLIIFFLFSLILSVPGQKVWTGNGNNSNWNDGANWQDGAAPTLLNGTLLGEVVTINYNSAGYYPVLENISIGDSWEMATGSITITPRARLIVNGTLYCEGIVDGTTYGTLIIQADATSHGMLRCGNVTGTNMFVELYLTGGGSSDHFFVPGVQNMTICSYSNPTLAQVRSALNNSTFGGDLISFNEPSTVSSKEQGWQYWDGYGSTTRFNTITNERGYSIYLPSSGKIRFKGTINSAQKTFSLPFTQGNSGAGWNLVGNPYPINYDLRGIPELMTENDNVSNTIYFYHNGVYEYWNPLTEAGNYQSNIVPAMQGFFVKVTATGKSLTLPTGSKVFSASHERSKGSGSEVNIKASDYKKIRLNLTSGILNDETIVLLTNYADINYNENYDGLKLFGSSSTPSIYTNLNGIDYYMKAIGEPSTNNVEVPIKLILKQAGTHTISVADFANLENINVKLKHGAIETPLNVGTAYSFNLPAGTYEDFSLLFSILSTGIKDNDAGELKTWYANDNLYINVPEQLPSDLRASVYDLNGKTIFSRSKLNLVGGQTNQVSLVLTKGFYLLELEYNGLRHKAKFIVP